MKKSTREAFKRLEEGRKSLRQTVVEPIFRIPALRVPLSSFRVKDSAYAEGTLGYLADQLNRSPEYLVEAFSKAGISGLTPTHRIDESQKEALLKYLRASIQNIYIDDTPVENRLVFVEEISIELIRQLAAQPILMHQLDPRRFEELVARLLENQGCEVHLTKRSGDGGYDIFGRIKGTVASPVFLAECKRYAPDRKVGVETIRGLYGVTEMRKANLGIVITTSSFTRGAWQESIQIGSRIELREFNDLRAWLSAYQSAS